MIFEVLIETLMDLLGVGSDVVDEIVEITRKRSVTIECEELDKSRPVRTTYLRDVLGTNIEIAPSDYRREKIKFLKGIYTTREDRVNKMAYH